MNNIIDDEQFADLFKETIASDYKDALLFMRADPDVSLMKFRKILESLCLLYKEHYSYEFDSDNLYDHIEELASNNIIAGVIRESFHEVRILTNEGVHVSCDIGSEKDDIAAKDKLKRNAIRSRKGILNLLEHAFLGLGIDKELPVYEMKVAGGQEQKNLWFMSLTSNDYNDHFRLGELYQKLAECYKRLMPDDNIFIKRSNSMFLFAAESYKTSFHLCSKKSISSIIQAQGKNTSIPPGSYDALFNYSLLCLKGKVNNQGAVEAKLILRALIKRGFTDAYSYLGWQNYIDEDYKSAYKYLNNKKITKNVYTFHKLGILYSEGKACPVNIDTAIDYFQRASELGDTESMFELGKLYHKATEVDNNDALSQEYLGKAVVRGHVDAVIYLDDHYLKLQDSFNKIVEETIVMLDKAVLQAKKLPIKTISKQGRNELCSCDSGIKNKNCCGTL
jgi:TPR repeat protein